MELPIWEAPVLKKDKICTIKDEKCTIKVFPKRRKRYAVDFFDWIVENFKRRHI